MAKMGVISALAYYKTALLYYLLGGITFLPLCIGLIILHHWLAAPVYRPHGEAQGHGGLEGADPAQSSIAELVGEGELSEERKRQALALAKWNAEAQNAADKLKGKEASNEAESDIDLGIPSAARRVKPAQTSNPRRPHQAGWLTVRRHFESDGVSLALQQAAQQASNRANGSGSSSNNGQANRPKNANSTGSGSGASGGDGKGGQGYMSMMYRGMLNYRGGRNGDNRRAETQGGSQPSSGTASSEHHLAEGADPSSYKQQGSSSTSSTPTSNPTQPQLSAAKETFYCILKGPILYLYSSADPSSPETECQAAIDVRSKRVSIFVAHAGDTIGEPDEGKSSATATEDDSSSVRSALSTGAETATATTLKADGGSGSHSRRQHRKKTVRDGELFYKRNAIRIVSMGAGPSAKSKTRYAQWFLFAKSASTLEDWYHTLVQASVLPETGEEKGVDLIAPVFQKEDMANLLANLDAVPDPIPLRWLNAIVGRVFFSIYRTAWLEDYVASKFRQKMSRVRTPGFLSDIRVREVDLGNTPPAFSRPMLKSLTGDGEASMEVDLHYTGSLRLTLSTVLTISLGQRFKPYSVTLVLAVILNSLEGNLLLQVKPPPSNRIWFGFTKLPKMDISVEPVVSERKVQWSMVKRLIEGRLRELLTESLVVPNMDDIPFFDSRPFERRGGIWAEAAKEIHRVDLSTATGAAKTADQGSTLSPPTPDPSEVAPQSKSTPASVLNVPVGDGEGEQAKSSSFDATNGSANAGYVRQRKGAGANVVPDGGLGTEANHSDPNLLSTSPAAAGLSALLARDQASSAKPKRAWFASSGRSNSGKSVSSTSTRRRSGAPQSSLAWGSASLSDAPNVAAATSSTHERNKDSIASISSVEGDATDASADLEPLTTTEDEEEHDASSTIDAALGAEQDTVETTSIHSHEEGIVPPTVDITPAESESEGEEDARGPKLAEDLVKVAPAVPPRPVPQPGASNQARSFAQPPPPQRNPRLTPTLSASGSPSAIGGRSSPAARSLASIQRDRYGQSAAVQSGTEDFDATSGQRPAGGAGPTTSATLLNTWNKAKASMADKDSRQAAARDARDALKRGWANWNTRRSMHQAGMTEEEREYAARLAYNGESNKTPTGSSIQRLPSQQATLQSQAAHEPSGWLASSPEDPASMGAGFDGRGLTSSPSVLSLDLGSASSVAAEEAKTISRPNSVMSGRKPYREHRADKARLHEGDEISRTSSRASSTRSSDRPTADAHLLDPADVTVVASVPQHTASDKTPETHRSGTWDAIAPGLRAPDPAVQRDDAEQGQPGNVTSASPKATRSQQPSLSTSPSSVRRASALLAGASAAVPGSPESAKAAYNFVPGQPTTTVGLSGVDLPTLPAQEASFSPARTKIGVPSEIQRLDSGGISSTAPASSDELVASLAGTSHTSTPPPPPPRAKANEATPATPKLDSVDDRIGASPNLSASPPAPPSQSTGIPVTSSSAASKGIKQQPMRATMMAVPGIPSMQKAGPQSFEAPPPPPPTSGAEGSASTTSSPRLAIGNLIARIPSFGTVSGAPSGEQVGATAPPAGLSTPSLVDAAQQETVIDQPNKEAQPKVTSTTEAIGAPLDSSPETAEKRSAPSLPSRPRVPAQHESSAEDATAKTVADLLDDKAVSEQDGSASSLVKKTGGADLTSMEKPDTIIDDPLPSKLDQDAEAPALAKEEVANDPPNVHSQLSGEARTED